MFYRTTGGCRASRATWCCWPSRLRTSPTMRSRRRWRLRRMAALNLPGSQPDLHALAMCTCSWSDQADDLNAVLSQLLSNRHGPMSFTCAVATGWRSVSMGRRTHETRGRACGCMPHCTAGMARLRPSSSQPCAKRGMLGHAENRQFHLGFLLACLVLAGRAPVS